MMGTALARIVAAGIALLLCASPAIALLTLADGGVHNIDYAVDDFVFVDYKSPGQQTTLNILEGAAFPSDKYVIGYEDSIMNILGGTIGFLGIVNRGQVTVSGGAMVLVDARDNSQIAISGGSIHQLLDAGDSSQIALSGGSFAKEVALYANAVLAIHGSDFAVDGTPVGYIELRSIFGSGHGTEPYRQLTGTLLNGDPLNSDFRIGESARIVLIPEPATLLLLGLGGLGLLRKRRQV